MGEADIERVRWPSVSMAASRLLGEAGTRRAIIDSLCASPLFVPDAFGTDPDDLDRFDYEQASTHGTSAHPNSVAFHLRRAKAVGYEIAVGAPRPGDPPQLAAVHGASRPSGMVRHDDAARPRRGDADATRNAPLDSRRPGPSHVMRVPTSGIRQQAVVGA